MATEAKLPGFDDVADDAAAAYREAAERAPAAAPEPKAVETEIRPSGSETAVEPSNAKVEATEGKAKDSDADTRSDGRDARGRFAPKDGGKGTGAEGKAGSEAPTGDEGKAADTEAGKPAAEGTAAVTAGPPPSWSVKAKAAWDALPADVRADVAKREGEVAQGLAALRDYKDLKPFAERAQREGTTIAKALDHYLKMEDVLRRDVGAGLSLIAQNFGLTQQQAAQLFAGLAHKFGVPSASGGAQPSAQPNDPLLAALAPVLSPLQNELNALKGQLAARTEADRKAQSQTLEAAINAFAADSKNRFFPELQEQMVRLMETGMVPATGNWANDLRAAYDLAAYQHPEVREALIEQRLEDSKAAERKREQEAADKAKLASRSVTGSRLPGTTVEAAQYVNSHDEIEAVARAAYRLHSQH